MKKLIFFLLLVLNALPLAAQQWTYNTLSNNLYSCNIASIGNKIFFYTGGKWVGTSSLLSQEIEIFNVTTNTKQVFTAPTGAARISAASAVVENKVIFAGGYGQLGETTRVDLYDTLTGIWSTAVLSEKRANIAAATSKSNKAFFGGGYGNSTYSGSVDIYNSTTNTWSATQFPNAAQPPQRSYLSAAAVGNKILFAGGITISNYRNLVSVYDAQNNVWLSNTTISQYKAALVNIVYKNKSYFIGGTAMHNGSGTGPKYPSDTIDIYDNSTDTWSILKIPRIMYAGNGQKRSYVQAALAGCKIFMVPSDDTYGGGPTSGNADTIAVYDLARDSWSYLALPHPRSGVILAAAQNKIYFAGGGNATPPFAGLNHIDIYTVLPKLQLTVATTPPGDYSYDFGDVLTTNTASAQLDISNEGDYFLHFNDEPNKIIVTGDLSDFTLDLSALQAEDTLEPAQILNIPVSFHPLSAGEKSITLQVLSNDPDLPTYSFELKGNGTIINGNETATALQAISVYPVPCTDLLNIQINTSIQQASLRLTDLNGKIIRSLDDIQTSTQLPTDTIPNGIYLMQLKTEDYSYLSKVVIAH